MTEADWSNSTDPQAMLEFLRDRASDRKLRLFLFACMRRIEYCLAADCWRDVLEKAEESAVAATDEETRSAFRDAFQALMVSLIGRQDFEAARRVRDLGTIVAGDGDVLDRCIRTAQVAAASVGWFRRGRERRRLCDLVRDLFGPLPFHVVAFEPDWLAWDGGILPNLATSIYGERAFDRLPILADAKE